MSGHEQERLSAYLDDALPPRERAEVAAHLDACGECAARLAELAAVDAAVGTPFEAPSGYFESFPSRVRARLPPRAAARRLPAWTWAAAAALLLAVVTPLTLLRRPDEAARSAALETPAAAVAPESASPQARAKLPVRATEPTSTEASANRPRRPVVALASPEPKKREAGFAAAPAEADARQARVPAAPPAQAVAEPPPSTREEPAVAALSDAALADAVAPSARNQAQAEGERRAAESARDEVAPAAADDAGLAAGRLRAPAAGAMAAPKLAKTDSDWQRLEASRPRTPAEWRRLREAWRRFVASDPAGSQADEARVRTIEAGREAWRSGGDPADETRFLRDAADYLERDDARQKPRVKELLR
jgi:hypothetical protein